jgi:hypothetical protein
MTCQAYQIVWSAHTLAGRDPGFLELDNLDNQRPDWREYWPIRRFLLYGPGLDERARYGFLSPRFGQKTGLSAADVRRFVDGSDANVIGFSPYFDQMAFYRNIFEQAAHQHPGLGPLLKHWLARLAPGLDIDHLVMDSSDTLFCNYFVARPAFWRAWLELGERLFAAAEHPGDAAQAALNASVAYGDRQAPAKVFIIERLASLLLVREPGRFSVETFNPTSLPFSAPDTHAHAQRLYAMDALKRAWRITGHPAYVQTWQTMFHQLAGEAARRP